MHTHTHIYVIQKEIEEISINREFVLEAFRMDKV